MKREAIFVYFNGITTKTFRVGRGRNLDLKEIKGTVKTMRLVMKEASSIQMKCRCFKKKYRSA